MLEKLDALLHLSKSGEWSAIMGKLPVQADLARLAPMAQDKPAARKFAQGMAVTAPIGENGWHFWILSVVPGVSDLPSLMTRLQDLSRGIGAQTGTSVTTETSAASRGGDAVAQMLAKVAARLGDTPRIKPKALAPIILETLVELQLVETAALLQWRGRRRPVVWLSDERLYGRTDEISAIGENMRQSDDLCAVFAAVTPADEAVELAVVARSLHSDHAGVALPAAGKRGFGLVAFGDATMDNAVLQAAVDLLVLKFPTRRSAGSAGQIARRAAVVAGLVAAGVFLAQPAPTILTTVGATESADITVVTVPTDAYLTRMHVRVGDVVTRGALLAEFRSPTLEEALAEERLAASVEQLTAQAAFAENDISRFQLSSQRLEIVQARIAQLLDRQQDLTITAPAAGQIVSAMPNNVAGLFAQTGREVAQIQTSDAMRVRMELSRMDARLVTEGMTGTAYFRGLSQKSFDVTVLAPPTLATDPQSGTTTIETTADIAAPEGLIVGMTGFLRLQGPMAPRIVGYGRYVTEFIREKTWTYLGLQL